MKNTSFVCYHYDIARGAYLKPERFNDALRLAAQSGYTHFLPYLENMIRLPSMEKACPACAYTPDQWRQFDETAAALGIELMPHFNVIGHSVQVCQVYPELAGKAGEMELDVGSPATRAWTLRCLDEFCECSRGKHFLIGGDEWQTPNHLLAQPGFNVGRAWASQINLAAEHLTGRGRVPIVWHDMLAHYPEALDLLTRDAVVAFWFYDEDSDYPFLDLLAERGFRSIMASGICSGLLSRRRVRAAQCAIRAMETRPVAGFMMTSWEDCRWEKQSLSIPMVGELIQGREIPPPLLDAVSAIETLNKLPQGSAAAERGRRRLALALQEPAWRAFPDYHEYASALAEGDVARQVASYERFHFPEGPLYDRIAAAQPKWAGRTASPRVGGAQRHSASFGLRVGTAGRAGEVLDIFNGEESFTIYPELGASLQNWRVGPVTVIDHPAPDFMASARYLPGGYRSYSGVGGFRPIWAVGTHHNPCILWQGPFTWSRVEDSADRLTVELRRDMFHADVVYRVSVQRGIPGLTFEAEARNKLPTVYGAFNFNFVLATCADDIEGTSFEWMEGGAIRRASLDETSDSFFKILSPAGLTVRRPDYALKIESAADRTVGYFVDWATSFLTPDLRGIYRRMEAGETYRVQWRFSVETR